MVPRNASYSRRPADGPVTGTAMAACFVVASDPCEFAVSYQSHRRSQHRAVTCRTIDDQAVLDCSCPVPSWTSRLGYFEVPLRRVSLVRIGPAAVSGIQRVDARYVLSGQLEVGDVEVLGDAGGVG